MIAAGAKASPVSQGEALKSAREFFAARGCHENITVTGSARASRAVSDGGITPYYIFNVENDGGYVVISADDRARTVLAYSDSGNLSEENMPEACALWLGQYAAEIASLAESGEARSVTAARSLTLDDPTQAIAPQLPSRWDQTAPYNNECPMDASTGKRAVTGCVATALAQVMYYHRYPERPVGNVSYNDNGVQRALDFSTIGAFDWEHMTDTYNSSSTAEATAAVATLMKAAGYGVGMNYSSDTSIALFDKLGPALVNYFGYDSNLHSYDRDMMSTYEWSRLLLTELQAGRPVLYDGRNQAAGHTFVCDGYDGNGLFHFNWGWAGVSDGYFSLSALDPGQQSTGGSNAGYNLYNKILCNIAPAGQAGLAGKQSDYLLSVYDLYLGNATGYVQASATTTMTTTLANARLYFRAINHGLEPFSGETWAATVSDDGTVTPIVRAYCPVIAAGGNEQLVFSLFEAGLTDGTYRIGFYYRQNDTDGWHRITSSPSGASECIATVEGDNVTLQPYVRDASTLMIMPANGMSYLMFDRNDSSLQLLVSTSINLMWDGEIYGVISRADYSLFPGCLSVHTSVSGRNNRVTLTNNNLHPEEGQYIMSFYSDPGLNHLIGALPVMVTDKKSGIEDVASQDSDVEIKVASGFITVSSASGVTDVTLTDISGRRLPAAASAAGSMVEIDTTTLSTGVCVVTVRTGSGHTVARKVMIH